VYLLGWGTFFFFILFFLSFPLTAKKQETLSLLHEDNVLPLQLYAIRQAVTQEEQAGAEAGSHSPSATIGTRAEHVTTIKLTGRLGLPWVCCCCLIEGSDQ
jgi:hypothetical protein